LGLNVPPFPEIQGVRFAHVAGWEGYACSDDGWVWSCKQQSKKGFLTCWKRLKCAPFPSGYRMVYLKDSGRAKWYRVNRLIAETFIGPIPEGMLVAHYPDQNILNNAASNLMFATPKVNSGHMKEHGTKLFGEKHPRSLLNEEEIRILWNGWKNGLTSYQLADLAGCEASTLQKIFSGKHWKHLNLQ
jgi:hypothetical protein